MGATLPPLTSQSISTAGGALASDLHVSVISFGAKLGSFDSTSAIQACFDYCAANNRVPYFPGGLGGFTITDTITSNVVRISGEAGGLPDESSLGTQINFAPSVLTDAKPAFLINGGMGCYGVIENLFITGPHNTWNKATTTTWLPTPANLPATSAFANGVAAISVVGDNMPIIRNCSARFVKYGVYLNSTNGHISLRDCRLVGVFGVYCAKNSGDYLIDNCRLDGCLFASIGFGAALFSGNQGGFSATICRTHLGFGPYGIYQVDDASVIGNGSIPTVSSLSGVLQSVRFEQIGEAAICLLDKSVTTQLAISGFGMSWAAKTADTNAGGRNLHTSVIADALQQQFALRLGDVSSGVLLNFANEGPAPTRSPYATTPLGVAKIYLLDNQDRTNYVDDVSILADSVITSRTPNSRVTRRWGESLRRGDSMLYSQVRSGNLLNNPENPSNWQNATPTITNLASVTSTLGASVPAALLEELGTNPAVIRFTGINAVPKVTLAAGGSVDSLGQKVCMSYWACSDKTFRSRLELAGGGLPYDNTYTSNSAWVRVTAEDQIMSGNLLSLQFIATNLATSGNLYIAGLMLSYGEHKTYNPFPIATATGGLLVDDGSAPSVSSQSLIISDNTAGEVWLTAINGANYSRRRIPYVKSGGTLTLGTIETVLVGSDPVSSATSASGNISVACSGGTSLRWGSTKVGMP